MLLQAVAIGAAAVGAINATAAHVGDDGEVVVDVRGDDGVSDLAGHAGPGRDRKRGAHCAPCAATLLIITIQQLVAASTYLWAKLALLFS